MRHLRGSFAYPSAGATPAGFFKRHAGSTIICLGIGCDSSIIGTMGEYICPHCKKPVNDDEALLCLYCGESLGRGKGFMGNLKYARPRIMTIVGVLLILLSFFLLITR